MDTNEAQRFARMGYLWECGRLGDELQRSSGIPDSVGTTLRFQFGGGRLPKVGSLCSPALGEVPKQRWGCEI